MDYLTSIMHLVVCRYPCILAGYAWTPGGGCEECAEERQKGKGVGVRSLDLRPAAPEKTCPLIPDFSRGLRRARLRFAIDFKV